MAQIAIVGGGKWGQALYGAFAHKHEVCIASRRNLATGFNHVSPEEAQKSDYLVFAIATQALRGWLESSFSYQDQKILVAAKGIETRSGAFLNDILRTHVPAESVGFLAGPSFAAEVRQNLPTALVVHSRSEALAQEFASFFPDFIKCYTSTDVVGGEIAGAYKNVIAIAAGICEGLGLGSNAKAALISRGLVEMERFGTKFGAKEETFLGLSGAGDLFLTSNSTLSRNYRVGHGLAQGKPIAQILDEVGETAEGVETSKAIMTISRARNIHTPIAREVVAIIGGKNPLDSLRDLLK